MSIYRNGHVKKRMKVSIFCVGLATLGMCGFTHTGGITVGVGSKLQAENGQLVTVCSSKQPLKLPTAPDLFIFIFIYFYNHFIRHQETLWWSLHSIYLELGGPSSSLPEAPNLLRPQASNCIDDGPSPPPARPP
jgi:hypothetical protein